MRTKLLGLAGALLVMPACGNAQSESKLISSLERLAAQNDAEAAYHLGMAYQTGSGVIADATKALAAFRRSAAMGDPLGAYKLGCIYDGQGGLLPRDPDMALKHKLVAAEAGYALAQQDVAALYAEKGDLQTAVGWLEKVARQGWNDAIAAYASVYHGAEGVQPDPVKTAAYFRIFLERVDASDEQREWLKSFELAMTPEQRSSARNIVQSFRPQPTPLTIRALSGQRAAEQLVASSG